jgi:Ca-activated chloride channel family protein
MTPYTSFVAVEETVVTDGGKPRRVDVPVEMPEGVSYEGVFGKEADSVMNVASRAYAVSATAGVGGGVIGGIVGGVPSRQMVTLAPPPPAAKAQASYESRDQALKLDPSLLKLTGKAMVKVFLTDTSETVIAQLRSLGFELTGKPGAMKIVIGRIDASKLKQLSELAAVKYVAPATLK